MNSHVAIDIPAILQMAFLAMVVAMLLPVDRFPSLKGVADWRLGIVRSLCGICVAVASWSTIQVVCGTFIERPPQQVQVPIVLMPPQMGQMPGMPKLPGRDI